MKPFLFALFVTLPLAASNASAGLIDFETDGAGAPSGTSFPSAEYAGQGVVILDSDPSAASTFLNDTNPANVGTAIQGKYVNVGAFQNIPVTFVDLFFAPGISSFSFDWASGLADIVVSIFDPDDAPLGTFGDVADTDFVNGAGFTVPAGSVAFVGDTAIGRVRISDSVEGNAGLIVDNLGFQQVIPEPSAALLLGLGLALVGRRRRLGLAD